MPIGAGYERVVVMSSFDLRSNGRLVSRGLALVLLAGTAAGCSSQSMRFSGVDDIFTASTPNQRAIINNQNQPYPGDTVAAAPLDSAPTGSVSRSSIAPVTSQPLPAPTTVARAPAPLTQAPAVASAPAVPRARPFATSDADPASLASSPQAAPVRVAAARQPAETVRGWSRDGGTTIRVRSGDTVGALSRRYGVPADVIAQVNGMQSNQALASGQEVVIPVYGRRASAAVAETAPVARTVDTPVRVVDMKPAATDVPSKVPLPSRAPQEKVAVLPEAPKQREQRVAAATDGAASPEAKPTKSSIVAAEAPRASSAGSYAVQPGDTLSRIAKRTGVSVASLKAANGMQDGVLKIGQTLKVPAAGSIVAAEPAPKIDRTITASTKTDPQKLATDEKVAAYTPPKKTEKVIEQAESSGEAAPDSTGIGRMRWPVKGRVISAYSRSGGKANDGIDIAVPEGTPVKAAENGVVIYAGDGLKEFGNTVLVRHDNGLVTVYGNASELKVKRGQTVKRGDAIALSGMSGNADSPKLHFEVRKNSAPVDPRTFLE
jgi:murein DD-endopeptidase MepM/ murein hydrolase activator NlpD